MCQLHQHRKCYIIHCSVSCLALQRHQLHLRSEREKETFYLIPLRPDEMSDYTNAIARVMSPRPNEGLQVGFVALCQRCQVSVQEPALCTQCGIYGHPLCLNLEYFQGYPFCGSCASIVMSQYAAYEGALRREQWKRGLAQQIATWRARATEAIGLTASVGVALGGAAATAASAATALMRGVAQGALAAGRTSPRGMLADDADGPQGDGSGSLSLDRPSCLPALEGAQPLAVSPALGSSNPAVPSPGVDSSAPACTAPATQASSAVRARSAGRLPRDPDHCEACHSSNRWKVAHIRRGSCVGFPGVYALQKEALGGRP